MFNPLCVLLTTTLCWHYVSSRYVVQQPLYSPYSDYSSSYSGATPYQSPFHHQPIHSPLYSPPGTYFDQRQGVLRPFPGGGVPVLVDYHKRCSNQYVGLKAHPDQQQYYYVCKPDCVIFGKCQNLQIFNATSGQCVQHPPPEYIPNCTEIGRFPLYSDCHLYYKCEEDLQPKIYSCPESMVFSPANKKCINGNKCVPTQISPHSSYIPEYCANKFPPCFENGIFRSPSDCSLYYKCDLKSNGIYLQTRLRCDQGNFYDLQKNECLPAKEVSCDCIQVAELVYPKPHAIPFQPAVYPSQYDFDSMEESQYPVEQSKEDTSDLNNNCNSGGIKNESKSDDDANREVTTILVPTALETTLSNENTIDSFVLSDYSDIGHLNDKFESKEFENLPETTMSSEEITNVEGSGFEADSEETTVISIEKENVTNNEFQEIIANLTEVSQTTTADDSRELTDGPEILLGEPNMKQEIETMDIHEENTDVARIPANSSQPEYCGNIVESNEINDKPLPTDTHTKDITQIQNKKCLPKLTITSSNIDSELTKAAIVSENTRGSRSTLHEHSSAAIIAVTSIPISTQLAITKRPPPASESLEAIPHKDDLKSNLLDSRTNLETAKSTQSLKETATEQSTHTPDKTNFEHNMIHTSTNLNTTSKQTPSVDETSLIEDDVSYEDILDAEVTLASLNETTNEPTVATAVPAHTKKSKAKALASQKDIKATTKATDVQTTRIPFGNTELLEETSTTKMSQATTVKLHFTPPPSDLTKGNHLVLLNPKNKIEWNATTILNKELLLLPIEQADSTKQPQQEHKNDTLTQVDLREEELIPAHSKSTFIDELADQSSDLNFIADNFEKVFDDDYTTILADKETTTSAAITTATRGRTQRHQKTAESLQLLERETKDGNKLITTLVERTSPVKTTHIPTITSPIQATLAADRSANKMPVITNKTKENSLVAENHEDLLDVLDSENSIVPNQRQEVSKKEITSAETIQTTSNSKQHLPHTPSTTFTPTQTPTTTPKFSINTLNANKSSAGSSQKHSNTVVLHVRAKDHEQPSLDSPHGKSLYYILKTKPVINNNNNNDNGTVAAPPLVATGNKNIPRLEIIAQRPIDVHFSVCPTTCAENHKHNYSPAGKRAVLLRWFANKSKQTLGFETANE